jgi:DNA-binding beta-propeller fold protein YncE
MLTACAVLAVAGAAATVTVVRRNGAPPRVALPLRAAGELALPGDNSRFDYAALDAARGLLFIAHLGAGEVVEVDVHANRVVRTIPGLSQVHSVLVVPDRHRVYATATGTN